MTKLHSLLRANLLRTEVLNFTISNTISGFFKSIVIVAILLFSTQNLIAQSSKVTGKVDSTKIRIGEQIRYKINVLTDQDNLVVFPEAQSFSPMEVVEALKADTTKSDGKYNLVKEYTLTQFDSGSYLIPQQRVMVGQTQFLTDSIRIEVGTVVVDTTKQKMYPIKPAMEIPEAFSVPNWIWWLLVILLIIALVLYLIRRRKKKEAEAKKLPPYERALQELQELDKSQLLENRQTKEYYSKLTDAVRRYIEDEVHVRAMESTTSELINFLELRMQTGELKLSRQTIDDLKVILQRADLAKFANSKPDIITAKGDRSQIEHVINDTKAAIPEPTEEELLEDEAYRKEQLKKRKRKKVITLVIAGVTVLILGIATLIYAFGYEDLKDRLTGNSMTELLNGSWIRSEYGEPAVVITTPEVLQRGEVDMPDEAKAMLVGNETFLYGDLSKKLYIAASTMRFQQGVKFDLETAVEGIYANLESKGARNIIIKKESYSTIEGVEGIKIYGTLTVENPNAKELINKKYMILNFAQNGGFQQITVIYNEDNEAADDIAKRVVNSVEFDKTTN